MSTTKGKTLFIKILGKISNVRMGSIFLNVMLSYKLFHVFLLSASKSLLAGRLLKAHTSTVHATAPAQRSKSSKAARSNNGNEGKVKRKFKSEVLFMLGYSGTALPGALHSLPASTERDSRYLTTSPERIIYLSACENHIILFHQD